MQTNVQIDSKNLSSNDHLKRGGKYNAEVSTYFYVETKTMFYYSAECIMVSVV